MDLKMGLEANPRYQARDLRSVKTLLLAAGVLFGAAFGTMAAASAQGVHQYGFPDGSAPSGYGTSTGGRVHSGTAVPTGRGPLNQPVPPAASGIYSNRRAATPTYPSSHPFGSE
jgi:hypothetical protein